MKMGTVVLIEWEDSSENYRSEGWISSATVLERLKDKAGTINCTTVGFVVKDARTEVTVCASTSRSGQILHIVTIPKSCIRSIEILRKVASGATTH